MSRLKSMFKKVVQGLIANRRGQSVAELTMILPMAVMIGSVGMDIGRMVYIEQKVLNATYEGTKVSATAYVASGKIKCKQIVAKDKKDYDAKAPKDAKAGLPKDTLCDYMTTRVSDALTNAGIDPKNAEILFLDNSPDDKTPPTSVGIEVRYSYSALLLGSGTQVKAKAYLNFDTAKGVPVAGGQNFCQDWSAGNKVCN